MAVTLNANTSTGFIATSDTSGVLQLQTGGTTAVTVDASQNVGIGVTPSAWASPFANGVFEFSGGFLAPSAADQTFRLGQNHYYNGSSYIYKANGPASAYIQNSGVHAWYNAASGTAGNTISFTQAMTLNANGVLALQGASTSANGVGITFPVAVSASTNANTLDDYEEGTWTPTLTNCGGSASASGATYVKIGNVVTARLTIVSGTFTSNNSRFTLPFSSADFSTGTFSISTTTGGFLEAQVSNICYFVTTASGSAYCSITYIAS
jgi:hypothetical protein